MNQSRITPEQKLEQLGLKVDSPPPHPAEGNFVSCVRTGNLLFMAGQGVDRFGKLGKEVSDEEGYQAARETMLNLIRSVKHELGQLSQVQKVVKLLVFVNSTEDFTNQPKVANGASDLLVEVFGERGKHARSAVGMAQLPNNIAVEIEMVLEIKE